MPEQAPNDNHADAPAFVRRSRYSEELGVQVRTHGPVNHLGAESLERPLELPRDEMRKVLYIAAVAALLAIALIIAYNTTVLADQRETATKVEEVINREVTLDLPSLQDFAGRGNDDILASIYNAGYPVFDNTGDEDLGVDGFDVYKLAADVSPEAAAAAYAKGIEKASPVEAAQVLSGSWRLLMDRSGDTTMRLRYIDFAATTPETALNDAMAAQRFDSANLAEIEKDSLGNSNLSGSFEKDGKTYAYTISACDLSQVYDIDGLPETAQYVGVKVTG